jgi:hypothetical protein
MFWGAGPALGLLTFCGYLLFLFGAAMMWRNRSHFLLWVQDEVSFFHRSLSRHIPAGPFYIPRSESRFKSVLHCMRNSVERFPRNSIYGGAVLLLAGLLLFILDFFI